MDLNQVAIQYVEMDSVLELRNVMMATLLMEMVVTVFAT